MPKQVDGDEGADRGALGRVLPVTRVGRWTVLLVLLLALGLRVGAVMETRSWYAPKTDAKHFDILASSLASGEGFGYAIVPPNRLEQREPTAFRAPFFPMVLGAVYSVVGEQSWTAGRLLNAALGTVVVSMIGVVAAQLWSRRLALIAMALAAIHPALIVVGSSLQLEPLLVTLMLASVAAALQHRRGPRGLTWPILAGVLMGLSILTRETAFVFLPPVVWLIWTAPASGLTAERHRHRPLAPPLLAIGLAAAVVVPWTIRNAVVLGEFIPVTTSSGIGLSGTYNQTSMNDKVFPAGWREPWADPQMLAILEEMSDPTEAEADRSLRSASFDLVREHPEYVLKAALYNTQRLFDLDGGTNARAAARYIPYSAPMLNLGILASYGLYLLAMTSATTRRSTIALVPRPVWAIPLLLCVFIVLFLPGNIRYRHMIEPFLILLATPLVASWSDALQHRWEHRKDGRTAPTGGSTRPTQPS